MNETIKQLCEQSKVYANESTKDFTGNEPVVWMDYYTEKFAELIVGECIEQVEQAKNSPFVSLDDAKRMSHFVDVTKKRIEKHFRS